MSAKTKTSAPRYACALCGKPNTADRMVYSTQTGSRFCPPREFAACDRRAKKNARQGGSL